jgi:hypothetical protein
MLVARHDPDQSADADNPAGHERHDQGSSLGHDALLEMVIRMFWLLTIIPISRRSFAGNLAQKTGEVGMMNINIRAWVRPFFLEVTR